MDFKKRYAAIGALVGALALGSAGNAYAQWNEGQNPRKPVSGLYTTPWGTYCEVPRNLELCPQVSDTAKATQRAHAQRRRVTGNPIDVQDMDLTSAGNGYLVSDFIYDVDLGENVEIPFDEIFSSRTPLNVSFREVKRGLDGIIRARGPESRLTGEQKAFNNYLRHLINNTEENDQASLRTLNSAAADLNISNSELYNNGQLAVRPGLYLANISNGTQSTNMLLYFNEPFVPQEARVPTTAPEGISGQVPSIDSSEAVRAREFARLTDSIRVAQQRADSIRNVQEEQRPRQVLIQPSAPVAPVYQPAHKPVSPRYPRHEPGRRGFEVGLEASLNMNQDLSFGAGVFGSARVAPWMRIGAYGEYSISNKGIPTTSRPDTTQRSTELIGPGTYKDRTDIITHSQRENVKGEFGGELTFIPHPILEFPIRVGAEVAKANEVLDETSTISFTRNGQPLQAPSVISNSKPSNSNPLNMTIGAGARINLTNRLYASAMYNYVNSRIKNNQNRGKFSIGYRF